MRLIDADELLERMKKTPRYFAIKFDVEQSPTIDVSDLKEIFELVMPVVRDCYEKVLPIVNEQFLQQFAELQEKATAKKPIYDESYDGLCPNCKSMAFRDVWWYENDKPVNYSHCHFCGQKIDWSEDDEAKEVNKND